MGSDIPLRSMLCRFGSLTSRSSRGPLGFQPHYKIVDERVDRVVGVLLVVTVSEPEIDREDGDRTGTKLGGGSLRQQRGL